MSIQKVILKNNYIYNIFERIKYLGRNLTKEVQDLYAENSKTLLKELEDINKRKDILCVPGLEDNTVK